MALFGTLASGAAPESLRSIVPPPPVRTGPARRGRSRCRGRAHRGSAPRRSRARWARSPPPAGCKLVVGVEGRHREGQKTGAERGLDLLRIHWAILSWRGAGGLCPSWRMRANSPRSLSGKMKLRGSFGPPRGRSGQVARQQRVGEVLVADRSQEAADRERADRGRPEVGRGGIGAAVDHAVADLDASGKAVHQHPSFL